MSKQKSVDSELLTWPVELLRVAEPKEAERLSSTSWDTRAASLRHPLLDAQHHAMPNAHTDTPLRNHPDKIVHLSSLPSDRAYQTPA
jgi:hypothetical protein